MTSPRVLILGSTGFAGRNVWNELTNSRYDVVGLSRTSGCDLRDLHGAWRMIEPVRPDYIINCAAHVGSVNYVSDFGAAVLDDNLRIILNVYRIGQQLRDTLIINPIANCGYPGHLDVYDEPSFWQGPIHPSVLSYGSTRRMIDVFARCYHQQFGVRSANVIVPNMFGPYDSINPNKTHALNALVVKFVRAAKRGEREVEIWGSGTPIREWLYVRDFARIVRHVIDAPRDLLGPVNIAQNSGLSVDELAAIISRLVNYGGAIVKNPRYPDGAPKKVMDDRLFRQHFPDFRFTGFEQALRETIEYYSRVV